MKIAFIYGLRCPLTGLIRYIGKCDSPKERLPAHLRDREKNHRTNWITSLKSQGLKPALEVIAEVEHDNWQFWERSYIRLYRCLGFDLVNGTAGGDGFETGKKGKQNQNFGIKRSLAFRAHASASLKGIKRSPEFCAGISARFKGNLYNLGVARKDNTSGFVGIAWHNQNKKWRARVHVNRKEIILGCFSKIEDAVFVRALAVDKYYGNRK